MKKIDDLIAFCKNQIIPIKEESVFNTTELKAQLEELAKMKISDDHIFVKGRRTGHTSFIEQMRKYIDSYNDSMYKIQKAVEEHEKNNRRSH